MGKLVYGVGYNDADYNISKRIDGKKQLCPFYKRWHNMLKRCYSSKWHELYPTYIGCTVCEEWLTFSNFKAWMETQDWEGKSLDKDLLSNSNVYSPETCVFIDAKINSYITLSDNSRGVLPIGVTIDKNKYSSKVNTKYLGNYDTALEAHQAWQREKIVQIIEYQNMTTDVQVKDGLQRIINILTEDLSNNNITTSF